jgi:hypothetical protein
MSLNELVGLLNARKEEEEHRERERDGSHRWRKINVVRSPNEERNNVKGGWAVNVARRPVL